MDELEWLKANSPSAQPSRDTTKRHRTQLRAEIASEGADGTRPQRPRRGRRSRHRVLLTSAAVVAICAIGAGAVALASGGGGDDSSVGAPANRDTTASTAPAPACTNPPPQTLAIPDGFGNPVAGPAQDATTAPSAGQQVTTWSSGATTIEQRWPADPDVMKRYGPVAPSGVDDGSSTGAVEGHSTIDGKGIAHRLMLYTFAGRPLECSSLQVTVSGRDEGAVDAVVDAMSRAPFRIREPLVTTTAAALAAPDVVACEGVTRPDLVARAVPAVATVGGPVTAKVYAQPTDALANFLPAQKTLAPSGYAELRLPDASVTYVKEVAGKVVTTVHVTPTDAGWMVTDWQASGC